MPYSSTPSALSAKLSVFSSSSTPSILHLPTTYGKFRLRGNSVSNSSRMKRLFNR